MSNQLNKLWSVRVSGISVNKFTYVNKITTFIQCNYNTKWII